jgi:hypothetical protein
MLQGQWDGQEVDLSAGACMLRKPSESESFSGGHHLFRKVREMFDDDSEKEKHKEVFEKVAKAIRENPKNYVEKLAELGFTWVDDEIDDEDVEERSATIHNDNEKILVAYFDGETKLSDQVLDTFLAEKNSDDLNYPLFRRYFKRGNNNLKYLLLYGLEKHPTDIGLLSDLAYYHEFRNILGELIEAYLMACARENDLDRLSELVMSFYLDTEPDGFDALHELEQVCSPGSDKWKVIQSIRKKIKSDSEPHDIRF